MRLLIVGFSLLFCFVPFASAQEEAQTESKENPRTLQAMKLSITRKEVRELWGVPVGCRYSIDREQCTAPDEYDWGKLQTIGILADVYRRKTKINTYEVRVYYGLDHRKSRRHPEVRVHSVQFELEKPIEALPTLRDLVEVLDLCNRTCEMHGDHSGGVPLVSVFPQRPTLNQRRQGDLLINVWEPMPLEDRDNRRDWMPTFKLYLEEKAGDRYRKTHDVGWFTRPVTYIKFQANSPRRNLEIDRIYGSHLGYTMLELGTFDPKSSKETGGR